jgi:hypothetical protein
MMEQVLRPLSVSGTLCAVVKSSLVGFCHYVLKMIPVADKNNRIMINDYPYQLPLFLDFKCLFPIFSLLFCICGLIVINAASFLLHQIA